MNFEIKKPVHSWFSLFLGGSEKQFSPAEP